MRDIKLWSRDGQSFQWIPLATTTTSVPLILSKPWPDLIECWYCGCLIPNDRPVCVRCNGPLKGRQDGTQRLLP